ncbi:YXWGXW repeat-containing protein [Dyella sp. LX-66]|uniref:YXWGXW repeat-containing protein n=1 Tax=unclassified Dyella TaxID=2634549 RepID=UPI001BDFF9D9|nr:MULTISPECIES: YXWGXW repeat-containing protein [unclassified Dyella]MBT2119654.1 YXWGXW repeat-containing protein [Dyella sp. LX-1]MBT2142081.1 YXWGXW repeat-containing protein [Dyella sp. LX-66]
MSFASNRVPFRIHLSHSLLGLALLAGGATMLPSTATAGVFVSVNIAPPPLPVYVQPPIPAPGYLWVPGYWAYDDDGGYFWVPGTWVEPPYTGALWTPAWWGWSGGVYVFHTGYWGPRVGFYGGINYGFGYTGVGYAGGYWNRNRFYYNRSVNNVSTHITNVYNKTVINNITVNHTSYNGGPGGIAARATAQELQAARMQRNGPVAAQRQQMSMAAQNRELRASANHGAPSIAATPRVGAFAAREAMPAHAAMAPNNTQAHVPHATLPSASFAPHANRAPTPQPRSLDMASPRPAQPMHNTAPAYRNEAPQRASYAGQREMPRPQPSHAYAPPAYRAAPMSAYHPQQGGGRPQPAAHAQAPRGHDEHQGH